MRTFKTGDPIKVFDTSITHCDGSCGVSRGIVIVNNSRHLRMISSLGAQKSCTGIGPFFDFYGKLCYDLRKEVEYCLDNWKIDINLKMSSSTLESLEEEIIRNKILSSYPIPTMAQYASTSGNFMGACLRGDNIGKYQTIIEIWKDGKYIIPLCFLDDNMDYAYMNNGNPVTPYYVFCPVVIDESVLTGKVELIYTEEINDNYN